MTEDEAKTKWCPFARVIQRTDHDPIGPFNRHHFDDDDPEAWAGDGEVRCIASGCMAWRTTRRPTGVMTEADVGFCGLAGAAA